VFAIVKLDCADGERIRVVEAGIYSEMPAYLDRPIEPDGLRASLVLFSLCDFEYGPRELALWIASLTKPYRQREPNFKTMVRGRGKHEDTPDLVEPVSEISTNGRGGDHE
jgi:hypothetical protein